MIRQLPDRYDHGKDGYGDSRQQIHYDRFKDLDELANFINTQCGGGEESCCRKPNCPHYRNLLISQQSRMLIKHWSRDFFKRDRQEIPYCSIRNQPVENST